MDSESYRGRKAFFFALLQELLPMHLAMLDIVLPLKNLNYVLRERRNVALQKPPLMQDFVSAGMRNNVC
ncbi:MAG: hypothetical protein K940chlam7_01458 [Chlamydiae bacterium]|nr:hypothetical protein [Chlamydiota bacterium]